MVFMTEASGCRSVAVCAEIEAEAAAFGTFENLAIISLDLSGIMVAVVKAHTLGSLSVVIGRDRSIHLFSLEKRREAATGVMNNVVLLVFLWSSFNYLKLENI